MVAFIRLHAGKDLIKAREAFQGASMELDSIQDVGDSPKPVPGILNRYAANDTVDFVAF
jgi:hypothetical protein